MRKYREHKTESRRGRERDIRKGPHLPSLGLFFMELTEDQILASIGLGTRDHFRLWETEIVSILIQENGNRLCKRITWRAWNGFPRD